MKRECEPLWKRCVSFHGHACGGLAVGLQVRLYMELLKAEKGAENEELVCIRMEGIERRRDGRIRTAESMD